MNKPAFKHLDCRNYASVDVAKGICHRTKDLIAGDADCCEHFDRLPKCKFCSKYTASKEDYLGICAAETAKPMTYPDLAGVTCNWFEFR